MFSRYIMGIIYGKCSIVLLYLLNSIVNNNYTILKHVGKYIFEHFYIYDLFFTLVERLI